MGTMAIFGMGKKADTSMELPTYCAALVNDIPCGTPAEHQQLIDYNCLDNQTLRLDIPLCAKHTAMFQASLYGITEWRMIPMQTPSNELPPNVEHPRDFRAAQRQQNTEV